MKTIHLIILIVAIIIPVSFGIMYLIPTPIPHATLEIHGMKDAYTVGEKYSFYYTLEGFGRSCHSVTVSYPNDDGKIIGWGADRDCNIGIQNKEFFYDSREHGFHHNSLVPQIPGIYKVSVHIENIQPVIFEFRVLSDTENKQPLVINVTRSPEIIILDDTLERILEYCKTPEPKPFWNSYWENDTHFIVSTQCEFHLSLPHDEPVYDEEAPFQEIIIDEKKGGNDYGIATSYDRSYSEYPTTRNLDGVLKKCKMWENARAVNFTSPDGTKFAMTNEGYEWFNSTHYIDSNICDFIPMKEHIENSIIRSILEYCGSSHKLSYDNPYEHWFANETHYIDADTCLWQHLDDGISLVLPNWKNVYSVHPENSWYNNQINDTDLQSVMDSCANESPKERMREGLTYSNGTHVFTNHGCEWKKIGTFMGE